MPKLIDTKADVRIRELLNDSANFALIAGAGSGKTMSLIMALQHLRETVGAKLRRDGQKIVCLTYTNRAVDVISDRLEWDDLFLVSTLHAFLWAEVKKFTSDIREALREQIIPAHIEKKQKDDNGGQSKKAVAAREKIAQLNEHLDALNSVVEFVYDDSNFSNYSEGQLNHDDVIDVAAYLILKKKILCRILGQKYPYLFVDEAQDAFENVIEALNKLCEGDGVPIVGYFGDPMQQIYDKRVGDFGESCDVSVITKEENFRCSQAVVKLLNAFRKDVQQYPAGTNASVEGSVSIRLVASEEPEGKWKRYTEEQLERASTRFEEALESWGWKEWPDVKQLFLVRQMIARRLGFPQLQNLFTGNFASSRAQEDYESGRHFLVKPFVDSLCSLVKTHRNGDTRAVLNILRQSSPTFDAQGANAERPLGEMKTMAVELPTGLSDIWGHGTLGDILRYCRQYELCKISDRLSEQLDRTPRQEEYDAELHIGEKGDWLTDRFLKMSTVELESFVAFVIENTPLSTQHGVKGEEYRNVLVVFDDIEAAWHNYSFVKTLAPNAFGKPTDGQYDRSSKLAYVCFSRAEENLRILLFTPDPIATQKELITNGLFDEGQIVIA